VGGKYLIRCLAALQTHCDSKYLIRCLAALQTCVKTATSVDTVPPIWYFADQFWFGPELCWVASRVIGLSLGPCGGFSDAGSRWVVFLLKEGLSYCQCQEQRGRDIC
jgi:hypothetical protein